MAILATTDLSQKSIRAIQMAAYLCAQRDEKLVCLYVLDAMGDDDAWRILVTTPAEIAAELRQEARRRLEALVESALRDLGVNPEVELLVELGEPSETILEIARSHHARMIATGTRGHSALVAAFLGSTATKIVREGELPVLMVPPEQPALHPRIIVAPVDLSACSRASLLRAAELARELKGKVHLLHAVTLPTLPMTGSTPISISTLSIEKLIEARKQWLEHVIEQLGVADVVGELAIRTGEPAHVVHEFALETGADLICMGTHGRRGLQRFLLGSTAQRVLRQAPCAVYVLREEHHDTNAEPAP
jgi:nucleotide-binding universal stress UspA family protein